MKYFLTLYLLRLKATLHSVIVWVSAIFFIALAIAFGVLLPKDVPASLSIGILPEGEIAEKTLEFLLENQDYTVIAYSNLDKMREDILKGKLHCGYNLSDEWQNDKPINVYYTDGSYLRPLLDQLVLSAYFEAKLPRVTNEYMEANNLNTNVKNLSPKPMTVELHSIGKTELLEKPSQMQPLLYAVVISLFVTIGILQALLISEKQANAQKQLRVLSGHHFASIIAPTLANTTVNLVILLAVNLIPDIWAVILLALITAIISMVVGYFREKAMLIATLLPPWILVSVFFSGALIDPTKFPYALGILRFLSPAWYIMKFMMKRV